MLARRYHAFRKLGGGAIPVACLVLFLVIGGITSVLSGIDALRVERRAVAGTLTPTGCEPARNRTRQLFCVGSFASDDGTVHIERVRLFPRFDEEPRAPLRVVVSGPGADYAYWPGQDAGWGMVLSGVVITMIGVFALWLFTLPQRAG
ncbi:hypothetical protein [Actinoplanes sp. NPDC049118]|uniref:hypothetical protein n=1 Tax=Actinoplanes sp. NPDC049118 TaxID=3155769 RepID=UPI0033D0CA6C